MAMNAEGKGMKRTRERWKEKATEQTEGRLIKTNMQAQRSERGYTHKGREGGRYCDRGRKKNKGKKRLRDRYRLRNKKTGKEED